MAGEKKLADFGAAFLEAIRIHVAAQGKQTFAPPLPPRPLRTVPLGKSPRESYDLFACAVVMLWIGGLYGWRDWPVHQHKQTEQKPLESK